MGVYIKGMEMPNKKNGAVVVFYPDGKVRYEDGKEYKAVPVPPHGRLIDADALKESISCIDTDERKVLSTRQLHNALIEWIDGRHTIIEAEEGET